MTHTLTNNLTSFLSINIPNLTDFFPAVLVVSEFIQLGHDFLNV